MRYTEVDHSDLPQANLDGFARVKVAYMNGDASYYNVYANGKHYYGTDKEREAYAFAAGWNKQKDELDAIRANNA